MSNVRLLPLCILLAAAPFAAAQQPVPVGKGSYAAFPPPRLAVDSRRNIDLVAETEQRKLYLVNDDGSPVPSNKWYQNLLFQPYGAGLWAMPHRVDATPEGFELFFPTRPDPSGIRMQADFPLILTGSNFKPRDSRAKSWTDWTVAFRLFESDSRFVDVTLGEGMPAVWCEFTGVHPLIALGGPAGKGSRGRNPAAFFDLAANPISLPATGDTLGIAYEGRNYALFAPDATRFEQGPSGIAITFAGKSAFLVLCPLPAKTDIAAFHAHAFAVPRDTKLSWNYDRSAGLITTTWKVAAEPLKGDNRAIIQGWLPHHWRETTAPLHLNSLSYATIRGPMKCAAGNEFTLRYPFNGILPTFPAPRAGSTFDAKRMASYLADHFANNRRALGADTYWGGKDLQRYAQAALIASQTRDPSLDPILARLRASLENWLTYTPGEKERFFAYYPRRKGLVGFNVSYGSQHFTDHHFHLGYFVHTAGVLSQLQPEFASQYGDMARLIARNYASHDRADRRFPFFRTFDLWRGHSFADGNGFPEGNNQESTGEAVNSWAALILLGEALGDAELTAAGVMGYSLETRANLEYWFDPHGDVFPASYPHNAAGMVWCDRIVWGTWFTASPAWIYGIQWLPTGPHAAFFDRDPSFIKKTCADAVRELDAFEAKETARKPNVPKKPAGLRSLGGELASYHLGFVMHADAPWVVNQLDALWAEPGDKIAHDPWMAAVYYQAHALRSLGRVDWTCHGSSPTSMVYINDAKRTFIAWNPGPRAQTVRFFERDKPLGSLNVAPHTLESTMVLSQ